MLSPEVNLLFKLKYKFSNITEAVTKYDSDLKNTTLMSRSQHFLGTDLVWNIPVCPYAFRILYYSSQACITGNLQ